MKEIRSDAKNIVTLLGGSKFDIEFYQRAYSWNKKQVAELIEDLTEKFLDSHKPGNERSAVENYGHYFLGSIIISDKGSRKFIIDGQQRLTTLTLLLIYFRRHLDDDDQIAQLSNLIISRKYGKRSFNLDVEDRKICMEALYAGKSIEEEGQDESVVNILQRFQDIEDLFPEELSGEELPYFADWLIENVDLVEITAYSDADAYTIFETMNDRGLSLTATDMLKGYLLANISDTDHRSEANQVWRKQVAALQDLGKEEEADAIKAWLRSQLAKTIRERKRGARPRDFDLIGTEFHRWVRDQEKVLDLKRSIVSASFIKNDFAFYTKWYKKIREAAERMTVGLEAIRYNAQNNFTLQYPVLLAPLRRDDGEEIILRKLRIVSTYLDILIARRFWNRKSTTYSTMQYNMFQVIIQNIRGKSVPELATFLAGRLVADDVNFASNNLFRLHGMNRKQIHRLLARMTDFVETSCGRVSRYDEYLIRRSKDPYEVEHIWANHFERHTDEFEHPSEFSEFRNRMGGLLLLPRSFNASYGDLPYAEKREHYFGQNMLAQSLYDRTYERNPRFDRFLEESGLPFRPHHEFKRADLEARQKLYQKLAEQIWEPDILLREAGE